MLATSRTGDDPPTPPDDVGLLSWAARGELRGDDRLIGQATAVWRAGTLADGGSATVPGDTTYVLWAGRIGLGRVVLLEGLSADGTPLVAQVSEHDDPPALVLDVVEELPPVEPVALAVTYDGNLDMPGLGTGEGAALMQLLQAPVEQSHTLWQQPDDPDDTLALLEFPSDGMSGTFLHLGSADDPGTRVVVAQAVGGNAGIAATIEVLPRHLLPRVPDVQLVDGPPWGPSGRIDGGELRDAMLASDAVVGASASTVREVAAGSGEVGDATFSARLLDVMRDEDSEFLVLVVRDPDDEVVCIQDTRGEAATSGAMPPDGVPLAVHRCIVQALDLLVTAVAATEGSGPVRLSGSTLTSAEDTERFIAVEPYSTAPRTVVVASLADDPAITVTLRPLPEPLGRSP